MVDFTLLVVFLFVPLQTGVERLFEGWDTGPLDRLETDLYRWSVGEQTSPLVIFSKAVKRDLSFSIDFE